MEVGGRPSGAPGVLCRLRRGPEGRLRTEPAWKRLPLVPERPPVRELRPRAPAAPRVADPARRGLPRTANSWRANGTSTGTLGVSYSRAQGNLNLPAVYTDRMFRAFRGFGGPNCGVGVTGGPDTSPAGMVLGPLGGAVAGQGPCMLLQPVQQRHPVLRSAGVGARENTANPDYIAASGEFRRTLRLWLNEEVDLFSTSDMFVADAHAERQRGRGCGRLRHRIPVPPNDRPTATRTTPGM